MSSRNLKSAQTTDLNVQGLAMGMKNQNNQISKVDASSTHVFCKRELEKLRRELNTEKNNCRKLKASLSELKHSQEDIKSSHVDVTSSLNKQHKEEFDLLESKHVKILSCLNKKHKEEIQLLEIKHNSELEVEKKKSEDGFIELLNERTESYENMISLKIEQIENLKIQVAESLEINSVERHKQIEELMKELQEVSEEVIYLKGVIEDFNSASKCQKCSFYENKYKELAIEMATRNENFKALIEVCSKMETQLSQQDELCLLLASLKKVTN